MAVKIGPKIAVEGEPEYRKQMQNIIQQTKTLASEMKALSSSFDKDKKSLKQNSDQRKLLTDQIKKQEEALKLQTEMLEKSTAKYGEADNNTLKYKQNVAETAAELNRMKAELDALPTSLELVGQKMQTVGQGMQTFGNGLASTGRTLTRTITAPIVGAGVASIKFGAEFDEQMSAVQAVTQASAEDLNTMREAAISWGEKTVYTAKEAGDALYYMGLAGWSAEESTEALGGVLNLAAAGGTELGITSDIVTDGMTAMGYAADGMTNGVKNADHYANVMAQTMSNSNTTIELLGESFKYVAPVAGSLGYNIEDLSIALGLMANNGIKGSTAGTALRNILTNMANPSKTMQTAMDELGVSLHDSEGNMKSLGELMGDLRTGFGDLAQNLYNEVPAFHELNSALEDGTISEEEYDEALQQIIADNFGAEEAHKAQLAAMLAGKRGMAGLLAIVNTTDEEYQDFTETIYSSDDAFGGLGAAAGIAQGQMDNLAGDFKKFTSALGTSQILISDMAKGSLREFVQKLTDLVVKFNALDETQKANILKWVGMAAAIGPILLVGGKLIAGIGKVISVIGTLATWIPTIVSAISTVATVITGTVIPAVVSMASAFATAIIPILPIVAAIGAVIAVGVLLYKHWDEVKAWASNLWEQVKITWEGIKNTIGTAWEQVKTNTATAWNNMMTSISNIWNSIKTTVTNAVNAVSSFVSTKWEALKTSTSNMWDGIKTSISTAIESAKTVVTNVLDSIKSAFETKIGAAKTFVQNAINAIKGFFNFSWSLPPLKLPHISISGEFSLSPLRVPHFSIQWYKKAMGNGMILNGATIFGQRNGKLLGGGEAGPEVVVGASSLYGMIQQAVGSTGGGETDIVINVYGAEGQNVNELAREIEKRLTNMYESRRMVFGQ